MAAVGLCGIVSETADPITSSPETKATLLRSIKPMTRTEAPVTRKMGCQRARANRRMPMTDSRAAVRSNRRSRRGRTGLAARDLPAGVDRFHRGRLRRCDRTLMAASCPPGGRYRVLLCGYLIVGFLGTPLHPVLSNGCALRPLKKSRNVKRVLITGMSGAGKSSLLHELAARGYRTVDTDYGAYFQIIDGEPRATVGHRGEPGSTTAFAPGGSDSENAP